MLWTSVRSFFVCIGELSRGDIFSLVTSKANCVNCDCSRFISFAFVVSGVHSTALWENVRARALASGRYIFLSQSWWIKTQYWQWILFAFQCVCGSGYCTITEQEPSHSSCCCSCKRRSNWRKAVATDNGWSKTLSDTNSIGKSKISIGESGKASKNNSVITPK